VIKYFVSRRGEKPRREGAYEPVCDRLSSFATRSGDERLIAPN